MKTIVILIFGSCLAAAAFAARPAAAQPGAPRGTSVDDKDVVKAAQFAIQAQQKALNDAGKTDKLTLVKVVSAKKQVVAGMNFLLTLQVKVGDEARTAEAKIWWQAWRKVPYQLTSWKFTEEQKMDDKYVMGERANAKHLFDLVETQAAVNTNNSFAINLYRQLAKEKQGKNVFFSPYSMLSALTMTANGARGETAAEMVKVLCIRGPFSAPGNNQPSDVSVINAGMAALNARYNPKPAAPETLAKIADLRKNLDDSNHKVAQLENQPNGCARRYKSPTAPTRWPGS